MENYTSLRIESCIAKNIGFLKHLYDFSRRIVLKYRIKKI